MNEILDHVYYHNTVREYLVALGAIGGGVVIVLALKRFLIYRLQAWAAKTPGQWDDFIVEIFSAFGIPVIQWARVSHNTSPPQYGESASGLTVPAWPGPSDTGISGSRTGILKNETLFVFGSRIGMLSVEYSGEPYSGPYALTVG